MLIETQSNSFIHFLVGFMVKYNLEFYALRFKMEKD